MIADAFLKGIIPLDQHNEETFHELLQYMLRNALTVAPPREYTLGMGRRALESYLKYGFIPLEDEVLGKNSIELIDKARAFCYTSSYCILVSYYHII